MDPPWEITALARATSGLAIADGGESGRRLRVSLLDSFVATGDPLESPCYRHLLRNSTSDCTDECSDWKLPGVSGGGCCEGGFPPSHPCKRLHSRAVCLEDRTRECLGHGSYECICPVFGEPVPWGAGAYNARAPDRAWVLMGWAGRCARRLGIPGLAEPGSPLGRDEMGGPRVAGRRSNSRRATGFMGAVSEWLKGPHWKCGVRETAPRVRIPPAPFGFWKQRGT